MKRIDRSYGKILRALAAAAALFVAGCGSGHGGGHGGGVIVDPPDDPSDPAPIASFSVDRIEGDVPFTIAFTNQSSNAAQYRWDFGDGTTSAEPSPRHEYTALGRYTIRLTAIGSAGAEASNTLQITACKVVRPFPTLQIHGRLHPVWRQQGDYEFGGHGPDTWMDATLHATSDGSQLYVDLHMKALETQADWSKAEDDWRRVFYTAPSGTRITTLPAVTELHEAYRDAGHATATTPGNALGYFVWKGDTDGEDIRNQTSDDTHMYFHMRSFPIRLSPR